MRETTEYLKKVAQPILDKLLLSLAREKPVNAVIITF